MKLVGVRPLLLAAVVLLPQWIWADSKLTQLTNLPTVYIETDGHRSITSKEQYIRNLRGVFARNSYIKVTFDEIEVMRHPVKTDFYGVTLHQGWSTYNKNGTQGYHDDGYVFLLWDFRNEQHPQIHVRTWQPDAFDQSGSGQKTPIPKNQVFSLADFDLDEE